MKPILAAPSLTDQVYDAIVDDICDGALPAGAHLVQERLAAKLGVSRQPVQQAMALLKANGMVEEIGGRGLRVAPLDVTQMRRRYEIRGALDGLAARLAAARAKADPAVAAEIARAGQAILSAGARAIGQGAARALIDEDEAFHELLYDASGNPLLSGAAAPHWRFLRRAMGEVLRHAEPPREIWRQHAALLDAVVAGDPEGAERLALDHVADAAGKLATAFAAEGGPAAPARA